MAKHAPKADRRAQILQAALTCFAQKGYHLTTMDDIVAESGLSKGSLYWHYKNKKDLLLSIMNWYFDQMEQGLEETVQTAPSATVKLRLLADVATQIFAAPELEPMVAIFIDFYSETRHDADVNAVLQQALMPYIDFVTVIIQEGIAAGEFKPVEARQIAIALLAAFDGMYLYRLMISPDFDWAATSRAFVETLLSGLSA